MSFNINPSRRELSRQREKALEKMSLDLFNRYAELEKLIANHLFRLRFTTSPIHPVIIPGVSNAESQRGIHQRIQRRLRSLVRRRSNNRRGAA